MSTAKSSLEDEEKKYFDKCVHSFRFYRKHALENLRKNIKDYQALPPSHQSMLKSFMKQQTDVKHCIEMNFMFILHMLDDVQDMFRPDQEMRSDNSPEASDSDNCEAERKCASGEGLSQGDMDRVYTTLRQFVRDWSTEGQGERDKCYSPIINAVCNRYKDPAGVSVLVPGAGLGRLAFEFVARGYSCEGNEFSIFMLIGSNFVLNKIDSVSFEIFPWSTCTTNNVTHADRVRSITVPDIVTTQIPESAQFGMCAGDFTEVYAKDSARFDVVAASFFLDTAHNIIEYIELIHKVLKPGGHMITLGPLLYHYAGMPGQPSLEIPWEDVLSIIEQVGFVIEEIEDVADVPYIENHMSMVSVLYKCKFLVARKQEN